MVTVFIPAEGRGGNPVRVMINGVEYVIPRGVETTVSDAVAAELAKPDMALIGGTGYTEVAAGGVFWATYGTTTIDELNAAYQAGKTILLEYQNSIYYLEYRTSTMYVFQCMESGQTSGVGITLKQILYTSTYNTWAHYEYDALAANQYAQNAGKFLAVGNDGKVTPVNAPSGGGEVVTATVSDGTFTIDEKAGSLLSKCEEGPVVVVVSEGGNNFCTSIVYAGSSGGSYTFVLATPSGNMPVVAASADDYPTATGG